MFQTNKQFGIIQCFCGKKTQILSVKSGYLRLGPKWFPVFGTRGIIQKQNGTRGSCTGSWFLEPSYYWSSHYQRIWIGVSNTGNLLCYYWEMFYIHRVGQDARTSFYKAADLSAKHVDLNTKWLNQQAWSVCFALKKRPANKLDYLVCHNMRMNNDNNITIRY